MGVASFAQTSFLGGEWSKQMQGRFDREDYRTGLNVCLNVVPIEEGAAPRRSGTHLGGISRNGAYAVLRQYYFDQAQPYDVELTAGHLRLWQAGAQLITLAGTKVTNIDTSNPCYMTSAGHGLANGDQVVFTLQSATTYAGIAQILGRQLAVSVLDSATFTVTDALTGVGIDGSQITFANLVNLFVYKIVDIATPYLQSELQQVRILQDGKNALLLHPNHPPQTLVVNTSSSGVFTSATLTATSFYDGPYLDIPADGTTLTPSATSGNITFTASAITSINGGQGFLSTDVGRMFRIFSEPLAWSGGAYSAGNVVKEAGVYWKAVQNSTGVQPSTDNGTNWVIAPTAAAWTWGTIQSITSASAFVGTLHAAVTYPDNTAGGNLLYTNAAVAWQLGAYSATTGYPAVGTYHQGRVWLGGAIKNRFDASVSNDFGSNGYINFAPTGQDGTVADNNGIAATLNAKEIQNFLWMSPDEQGVLAGTQSGEWIIASSSMGEPITPTSILARETTQYGSLNTPALRINRATIFAHRDTRKVYEYMANYFTQKFVADNLTLRSKHLTKAGVAELAYMRELTPVIWVRLNDGSLIGCTYKHDDPIKPMEFDGWHRHQLGTNRKVISIQGGPANGGQTDTLSMVTQDPNSGYCFVEFLQTLWDQNDNLLSAWYVDGGIQVAAAELIAPSTVRLYGLWYMAGQTVSVWGAGLDLGDYVVTTNGTIDLALDAANSLFTTPYLSSVTALGCTSLSVDILNSPTSAPITTYVMQAKENYDPARVTYINSLTSYTGVNLSTSQNDQGIQWDPIRRNLMYLYTEYTPSSPTTNTTGYTLWDGTNSFAPGATLHRDVHFNSSVAVKNIDTDAVNFYLNYNANNLVPNGIGGGNGTWRRCTFDFQALAPGNGRSGPGQTDPYTGNFWIDASSCELYCFRLADNYSQVISPLAPVYNANNNVAVVGFTNSGATSPWTFGREIDASFGGGSVPTNGYLYLIPKDLTATEISHDYLLVYAQFTYPRQEMWYLFRACNREVFDHAGNMFLFSCVSSGGKNFKLYKFAVPTSAPYGGPIVGGGFTDITPWASNTGPNADGTTYTLARDDWNHHIPGNAIAPGTAGVIPMYLPATDDLVLIEKFLPNEHTASSTDPSLMFWSVSYVHAPSSGSPTWDHHSAFVTGYMDANWKPTTKANAAYAVIDAFEVNNYLGQSDYDYTQNILGLDYTKRWFFFACTKMANGVSDNSPRIVLVEYQFVYGSIPFVVQVIDEQGWDSAYPGHQHVSNAYAPYTAETCNAVAAAMNPAGFGAGQNIYQWRWECGVYDYVTNSFWWGGGATDLNGQTAFFGLFDAKFANRQQRADFTPGGSNIGAVPPFLKLSFLNAYCAPFIVGNTYTSQGQILRPLSPSESMTQSGPSLGKFRRGTYAGVLFQDAQGTSIGVDFFKMRSCQFKTPGGANALPLTQTFSGVHWAPVDAQENYDNLWCWQITRPYPCTVVAVEFQHKANENT